jgi:alpha-N-arabinofuranosidase
VNVIAPLVTNDTGVLRQSTYYPYAWALRYARGRVLDLRVESETYPIRAAGLQADFARNDQVPFVDVVATFDAQNGQACVLMLNRDLQGEREIALEWRDVTPTRVLACETLTGTDLKAFNTFEQPRRVAPQRLGRAGSGRAHDVQAATAVVHGGAARATS